MVNESTAHLTAMLAGQGIAQTCGFMMPPHLAHDSLVELLSDWRPKPSNLHLVYPASRFPNQKLRAFSGWLGDLLAPHDARQ